MKGAYNQECNRTVCNNTNKIEFYNLSTRQFYCPSCAKLINSDNAQQSKEMYNSNQLCIHIPILELLEQEIEPFDDYRRNGYI